MWISGLKGLNEGTAFALQTARPSHSSNDHVKWQKYSLH